MDERHADAAANLGTALGKLDIRVLGIVGPGERSFEEMGRDTGQGRSVFFSRAEAPDQQFEETASHYADTLKAHQELGEPLPSPTGAPSKLNERQWVQVRTPNFRRWFGEWELTALKDQLRDVTGSDLAHRAASAFIGRPLTNADSGITATVSRQSLGKMLSQSAVRNSASRQAHMMAVANLDKLFPLSVKQLSRPDNEMNRHIKAVHHFEIPMPFDGKVLRVKMLVKETGQSHQNNPLYTVAAVEIAKPASLRGDADAQESRARGPAPPAGFVDRFAQMVAAVKGDGASKVLDDNGEPLVVYHGTLADVPAFQQQSGADAGFHFGTAQAAATRVQRKLQLIDREHPQNAGEQPNVMPVFLNIRRPLHIPDPGRWDDHYNLDKALRGAPLYRDWLRDFKRIDALENKMIDEGAPNEEVLRRVQQETARAFVNLLRRHGYDGVRYRNEHEGGESWMALDPEQVKSAVGNTGAFSPDNSDIRYRRASKASSQPPPKAGVSISGDEPSRRLSQKLSQMYRRPVAVERVPPPNPQMRALAAAVKRMFGREVAFIRTDDRGLQGAHMGAKCYSHTSDNRHPKCSIAVTTAPSHQRVGSLATA